MGSLIEELQRREAAARREADELRSEIGRLGERLARGEEALSRLEITRETVTGILGDAGVGQPAGQAVEAADPVPAGARPPAGPPRARTRAGASSAPGWPGTVVGPFLDCFIHYSG
jgi:hypothetical protein